MFLDASRVARLDDSSEKDGIPPVLVLHLVALEDQTTFVFPVGVTGGELGVFLDHDAENTSDMGLVTFLPSLIRQVLPLPYSLWVPRPFWTSLAASSVRDWEAAGVVMISFRVTDRATMAESDRLGSTMRWSRCSVGPGGPTPPPFRRL